MNKEIEKIVQSRQEKNRELLKQLEDCVNKYSTMRFGQILEVFGFLSDDPFAEESYKTLERVNNKTRSINY